MTIGAAKTALSTSFTPAPYSCFVSPKPVISLSGNGANTSPKINGVAVGGVGPFTYLWEIDNSAITINSPTEERTSFSASGFNTDIEGTVTLTVTDTGNGNAETTDTSLVVFVFGVQP